MTEPSAPRLVGNLPRTLGSRPSVWRDIKVIGHHAYIVSDGAGNHGMQVFDLTRLRDVTTPEVFEPGFVAYLRDLTAALEDEIPYVRRVTSLINVRHTYGTEEEFVVEDLFERWPETPAELARIAEIAAASPLYRNLYLSEDGRWTGVIVEIDPTTGPVSASGRPVW